MLALQAYIVPFSCTKITIQRHIDSWMDVGAANLKCP